MKILSQKTVYQSKFFRVTKKQIERDGKTFVKDFIERNSTVFIIPYTDKGEVYLETQYRDAFEKTGVEVVAGTIENDDDPLETAKRELQEETGLTAKQWKLIATWQLSVNMNSKIYLFTATDLQEGDRQLDDDEKIETIKMPLEDAIEKTMTGEMIASSHIAALLFFEKLQKGGKL